VHAPARRILVVDDDDDTTLSLATLLRLDGYEAHVARDGREALRMAELQQPDVILLDVVLPDLDGLEVCRRIRAEPWGKRIRVIGLSGWDRREARANARQAGFDCYLLKPVEYADLKMILEGEWKQPE
jgi:CheY-like chemotaxis protein